MGSSASGCEPRLYTIKNQRIIQFHMEVWFEDHCSYEPLSGGKTVLVSRMLLLLVTSVLLFLLEHSYQWHHYDVKWGYVSVSWVWCDQGSMFPGFDVLKVRCSQGSMFVRLDVSELGCFGVRCSNGLMFPRFDVPGVQCTLCLMFPDLDVPGLQCSLFLVCILKIHQEWLWQVLAMDKHCQRFFL